MLHFALARHPGDTVRWVSRRIVFHHVPATSLICSEYTLLTMRSQGRISFLNAPFRSLVRKYSRTSASVVTQSRPILWALSRPLAAMFRKYDTLSLKRSAASISVKRALGSGDLVMSRKPDSMSAVIVPDTMIN